jgi:hypothetical protein
MRRPAVLLVGAVLAVPGCGPLGAEESSGVHVLEIGRQFEDIPDLLVPLDDGAVLLTTGGAERNRVSVVDPDEGEVVGTARLEAGRPVAVAIRGERGHVLTVATDLPERLAVQELALPTAEPGTVHDVDAQPEGYLWQNIRAVAHDDGFAVLILFNSGPPRLFDIALDGRVRDERVLDLGFPGATFIHGELARAPDGGLVVAVGVIPVAPPDDAYARAWLVRMSPGSAVAGRPVELAPDDPFSSVDASDGPDVAVDADGTALLLLRAGPEPFDESTRTRLVTVDADGAVRTVPTDAGRDLDAVAVGDDSAVLLVSRAEPDDEGDDVRVSVVDPDGGRTLADHALCAGQGYASRAAATADGTTVYVTGVCGDGGAAVLWTVR